MILYRVYNSNHGFLAKVFKTACISTLCGTLFETVFVMWLFGSLWHRWTIAFKVATPILHVIFSAAQVWGSYNFYRMWQDQKKRLEREERGDGEEVGEGRKGGKDGRVREAEGRE